MRGALKSWNYRLVKSRAVMVAHRLHTEWGGYEKHKSVWMSLSRDRER